jgi:threonine/homoserine/homoserine lactone efflux protein
VPTSRRICASGWEDEEVTWQTYGSFVLLAALLMLIPGPDFAVVVKNSLGGGRRRGSWAAIGVAGAAAVQGTAAAFGLGALLLASQPVFTALRWAGAAYLAFLGVQALRAAWHGQYAVVLDGTASGSRRDALTGLRQGFVSNITNPKVIAFYLAVLPQFLPADATALQAAPLAWTHALMSALYLVLLAATVQRLGRVLRRRRVRRAIDAGVGAVLVGFGARLAVAG